MREVEIKFERENREGIVAVGTYLIDACKRFGIRFEDVCSIETDTHFCSVRVTTGASLLSPETTAESEYFAKQGRKQNERLACQVKIDAPGEVVIMTEEKVKEPKVEAPTEDMNEQYRKEFAELPLEKKIANLVQLETIALGETVSFIINSPFKIADKLMDVMAEFGFKKEEQQKEAARPAEHKAKEAKTAGGGRKTKKKSPPKPHAGQ
jgi:ferredoxin